MTHFHADAVRYRMRVSVHHYSSLCPIPSGTDFDTIDDAICTLGIHHLGWNQDGDAVRYDFYLELFSGTYRTGYDYRVDLCFRDFSGRFIKPDVVLQRAKALLEAYRSAPRRRFAGELCYDFRSGSVPFTGKGYRSRIRRHIRTTAERRDAAHAAVDVDLVEFGVRARAKRNFGNLPTYRSDIYRSDHANNGWKSHRKTQWRSR